MNQNSGIDLKQFMQIYFDTTKKWWGISTFSKAIAVAISSFTILFPNQTDIFAIISVLCLISHGLLQWKTDHLKGRAESLLRKFEMYDGLGWPVSQRELADLQMESSKSIKKKLSNMDTTNDYFISKEANPIPRILENLSESAWYTKHQAKRMASYLISVSVGVVILLIAAIVIVLRTPDTQAVLLDLSKGVIVVILFLFFYGYVRLAVDYKQYANAVERAEKQATDAIKDPNLTEAHAIKLLTEYQITRTNAPLLPGWLWNRMKDELNEKWAQQHGGEHSP